MYVTAVTKRPFAPPGWAQSAKAYPFQDDGQQNVVVPTLKDCFKAAARAQDAGMGANPTRDRVVLQATKALRCEVRMSACFTTWAQELATGPGNLFRTLYRCLVGLSCIQKAKPG